MMPGAAPLVVNGGMPIRRAVVCEMVRLFKSWGGWSVVWACFGAMRCGVPEGGDTSEHGRHRVGELPCGMAVTFVIRSVKTWKIADLTAGMPRAGWPGRRALHGTAWRRAGQRCAGGWVLFLPIIAIRLN